MTTHHWSNTDLSSYRTVPEVEAPPRARWCSRRSPKRRAAPGRHVRCGAPRRKPRHHTTSGTGQGHASRSQSSTLPAVVTLQWQPCFPVLMMFYFATHFLCCFSILLFLISFYLNHVAVIHSHLSSRFTFLLIQGKKYLLRQQKAMILSHQGFISLWARSFWQPNFILDAGSCTCLTKPLPAKCRLAKIISQEQGEETQETRCWPTYSRSSKTPTTAL